MLPPKLSLIIPCYNAAEIASVHLPELKAHLSVQDFSFDILLVDDGSKDGQILAELAEQFDCRLIKHSKNTGKGAAVKSGMAKATGDFMIFTDCDIPFGYSSITDAYLALAEGAFQIVLAERKSGNYRMSGSTVRNLGSRVFALGVRLILFRSLGDTQCGLKGFSHQAAAQVFPKSKLKGFSADAEWLFLASKQKIKIGTVPVMLHHSGKSSVSMIRHSLPMLLDLVRVQWWNLTGFYRSK